MKLAISSVLFCGVCAVVYGMAIEIFRCRDGVLYQENDCNDCYCVGGDLICRAMACVSSSNATQRDCVPRTTWEQKCNKCWCVKQQGAICTVDKC